MMNEIQKFMQQCVKDQMATAGERITITRPKLPSLSISANAVISARDGSMDANVGGVVYSITGHALLQASSLDAGSSSNNFPKAGDVLSQTTGEKWLIINAIQSSNDAGISCDLVRKQ